MIRLGKEYLILRNSFGVSYRRLIVLKYALLELRKYTALSLREFCVRILLACGVPFDDANSTATVLVDADLHGVDSHGVVHLSMYVAHLIT